MAKVIGIITCNYTSKEKDFTSADRPIAAVPYVGRYRVIDFPMSNMVNAGIRTIGVIMPKNFRSLTDHLGAGKEWSLARKNGGLFILPGTAFGTARVGSRFLIRDLIQNRAMLERSSDGYVVFSSANIVFNADLNELVDAHIASGADITAYTKIANEDDADVVAFDAEDGVVKGMKYGVKEGELAFLDTFVVKRSLLLDMLDWYAANDHLDLIEAALTHGAPLTINTFMYDGYCAAIFNKMSYFRANMDMLDPDKRRTLFVPDRRVTTRARSDVATYYGDASCVKNSLVADGCRIEGKVENSILFGGVTVAPGAEVRNCVILNDTVVGENARLKCVISDKNVQLSPYLDLAGSEQLPLVVPKGSKI